MRSFYRTLYTAAATDPRINTPAADATLSTATPTGEKHYGSNDPECDVQKRQWHTDNPAAVALRTPMSSPAPGTFASVPSTSTSLREDIAAGFFQHGTVDPLARQQEQAVVGKSWRVVIELVHEVHGPRDRVARLEVQLDLLLRVPRLVASLTLSVQAPRDPPATDQDTAEASRRKIMDVFASCLEVGRII
uniref:Uncharacterized protein n=1 Tax=Peronospora matthiolae TaxID=2874970 RepID=A0AAV1TRT2_9STRA